MKKIFISLLCILLISGCGQKVNNDNNDINNNQNKNENLTSNTENDSNNIKENKTSFDSYEIYLGVDEGKKGWYVNVPYLNEISKGNVTMFANGDKWWIAFVKDTNNETTNILDAKNNLFNIYFKKIDNYFFADDNGFVEETSASEIHSGIDMIKLEGNATDGKYESTGQCWVYGYIFMLGETPSAIIGMNCEDKSEETKAKIKTYVDEMVDTLVLK